MVWTLGLVGWLGTALASAPLPPDEFIMAVPVKQGSSFGLLMARYGLPERELRTIAEGVHDLRVIRPDRELQVTWQGDVAVAVRYQLDEDRTLVLEREASRWTSHVEEVDYVAHATSISVKVQSNMWNALLDAGLPSREFDRLTKVLEYVVDLNQEVHPGDTLTFVGDVRVSEGRRPRLGDLHAIRFEGKERSVQLVRFVHLDGTEDWYLPDGKGVKGAFLRSPLAFSDVSSGFSRKRFHPILGVNRPHNGTDFAAATGTPVRTVADGVVIRAGYVGGHGNYVEIRHDGTYVTSYSHLSRIGVKVGAKVRQGDVVGRVGSTGMATGPHLHYQMWRNGAFVDPMRVELPVQQTLGEHERAAFGALVALYAPVLDAPQVTSLAAYGAGASGSGG